MLDEYDVKYNYTFRLFRLGGKAIRIYRCMDHYACDLFLRDEKDGGWSSVGVNMPLEIGLEHLGVEILKVDAVLFTSPVPETDSDEFAWIRKGTITRGGLDE